MKRLPLKKLVRHPLLKLEYERAVYKYSYRPGCQ